MGRSPKKPEFTGCRSFARAARYYAAARDAADPDGSFGPGAGQAAGLNPSDDAAGWLDPAGYAQNRFASAISDPFHLTDPMSVINQSATKYPAPTVTIDDPPIQPVYPIEDLIGIFGGGVAVRAILPRVFGVIAKQFIPDSPGFSGRFEVTPEDVSPDQRIVFGQDDNQIYHAFRHIDELGLNHPDVEDAIRNDLQQRLPLEPLPINTARNGSVAVGGIPLQCNAYRLPNGLINVGTILRK